MRFNLEPIFAGEHHRISMPRVRFLVGRSSRCDLQVHDCTVSRQHCELLVEGRVLFVRDLDSSNGTFVNDRRVIDREPLHDGDVLAFSRSIYRITGITDKPAARGWSRLANYLRGNREGVAEPIPSPSAHQEAIAAPCSGLQSRRGPCEGREMQEIRLQPSGDAPAWSSARV